MEPADRRDQDKARVPAAGPTAEPQWLTGEERDAWIPLVGMLIKLPAALDAQLQRDAGLSHFEYMVLSRLSEAPDRTLRMSDLAILANGSLSRLSHVVTRLERRGCRIRPAGNFRARNRADLHVVFLTAGSGTPGGWRARRSWRLAGPDFAGN